MIKLAVIYLIFPYVLMASLLPRYDERIEKMSCSHGRISPELIDDQYNYFNREVPRNIHQIWFGDSRKLNEEQTVKWLNYSKSCNYKYKLWTEDDLKELKSFMRPINYELLEKFLKIKNYWCASDLVRYELLFKYGGLYVDIDFDPPTSKKREFVDFFTITPNRGLTLVTEHNARNIRESAIFVMNGIIMACKEHPVMHAAIDQIQKNTTLWNLRTKNYDPMFCTGPFFLNKILNGSFNVLPITYIKQLKMY